MDKDFLDKLVEHGDGQIVEVLVFVDQSDEAVCVLFVLFKALNRFLKRCDFSRKSRLFLAILCVQYLIPAIGELAENVVLIDFANQDFQFRAALPGSGKSSALSLDFCRFLMRLCFPYHADKFLTIKLCIFGNRLQHFGDEGQYHALIDTVLRFAKRSARNLAVLRAGVLRDALSVVDAVNIHLTAAICAVHQSCQGSYLTPAVWISPDITSNFLHKFEGLLVNNGFMGILENRPFILRNIVALLVLEVLAGLEIAGVSQVFTLLQNIDDSGRTPTVNILKSLVLIYAFTMLCEMSGRDEDFLL